MAVDIRALLTEEQRLRLDLMRREIERLYMLPDRWLAEELLKLSRRAREECPEKLKDPHGITYEPNFVWQVVPEIARRLGATRLQPNEAKSREIVQLSNQDLRVVAGLALQNTVLDRWGRSLKAPPLTACEVLSHSIVNGNPVAFALDRFAQAPEPGADRDDWLARHLREISRARGFESTPYWTPMLQTKREERVFEDTDCSPPALIR